MFDEVEVIYDENRWRILNLKRLKAVKIMKTLDLPYMITHGSIARGDVDESSDVEVVITKPVSPSLVITKLESSGFKIFNVELVMATPKTTPKIFIYLDEFEEQVISIPIVELKLTEEYFYKFSGSLTLDELIESKRVPGVNKELKLIIPTEKGHIEKSVINREHEVANLLGIPIEVVKERVEMLIRRREIGRTGLFIKKSINDYYNIENEIVEILKEFNVKWVLRKLGIV